MRGEGGGVSRKIRRGLSTSKSPFPCALRSLKLLKGIRGGGSAATGLKKLLGRFLILRNFGAKPLK